MKALWIAAIALVIFGLKALSDFKSLHSSSKRVSAEVVAYLPPTMERRTPQPARVTIRYKYNGKVFESSNTALKTFWTSLKPQDRIELVLNENDPSKYIPLQELPAAGYLGYVLIGAGILVFVFAVLKSSH